jgi:hypothetical protein
VRARLAAVRGEAVLVTGPADRTPEIADGSVQLVVTSPPFLDVVQYKDDNWLRCWFCGIDAGAVPIAMHRELADWQATMTAVFRELRRVLCAGGAIAFEVGEVRGGTVKLEEAVVPCALAAGLEHPGAGVHEDGELLGRREQPQGDEHQPGGAAAQAGLTVS